MKNRLDVFTMPITDHRSMCMRRSRSTTSTIPGDHPRAAELTEVALAYDLSATTGPTGRRDIRRRAAACLGMNQAHFDVLLAEHRMVTGCDEATDIDDLMEDDLRTILMASAQIGLRTGRSTTVDEIARVTGISACDTKEALIRMLSDPRYSLMQRLS